MPRSAAWSLTLARSATRLVRSASSTCSVCAAVCLLWTMWSAMTRRSRLGGSGVRVVQRLAFLAEDGDRLADGHDVAFLGDLLEQHAFVRRRHFHRHLVGHHLDDQLIQVDAIALVDQPLDDLALD